MPTNESSSNGNVRSESKEKPHIVISATAPKNDVNALRSDVNELSSHVQTAVGDLKKSIAEIRSSVSEMENPFNVLRTVNADSEKINAGKLPPGVQSIVLGKPEENTLDEKENQQKTEHTPKIDEIIPKKPTITPPVITPAQPIRASAYLDWIWQLLDDGLTAENIRQLANLCEMTNYLPKQANEFIYTLAVTAEKIRLIGFTKSHLLLFMYKAASLSKTNVDPEDMKALIDLTEQQLKNQKVE
ncbi:MAG: hypothetical protein M1490_03610 [Candidatus Bathyarchaeota archaeon]|nr:hypothetical protein [Candidatus Bathyarchaeota archaeon]